MVHRPRHRLAIDQPLARNSRIELADNAAHYLTHVLRLKEGDRLSLFNARDGEWLAALHAVRKKHATLLIEAPLQTARPALDMWVCFAPVKGGRLETILEKATELGAGALQPVITARTIVDKVNLERADSIVREAAEQCERTDWPEIREPVKLLPLLANWPPDRPLLYGDESGASGPLAETLRTLESAARWGVLTGPEGGFTAEEFAALRHVQAAYGVGLGPRILRADTAVITLCALTAEAWGDWHHAPHFERSGS